MSIRNVKVDIVSVLAIGAFIRQWGLFAAAGLFGVGGVLIFFMQRHPYASSKVLLGLPVIGPILLKQDALIGDEDEAIGLFTIVAPFTFSNNIDRFTSL